MASQFNYNFKKEKDIHILEVGQDTSYVLYYLSSNTKQLIEKGVVLANTSKSLSDSIDGEYNIELSVEGATIVTIPFTVFRHLQKSIIRDAKYIICGEALGTCKTANCLTTVAKTALEYKATNVKLLAFETLFIPSYGDATLIKLNSFFSEVIKTRTCKVQSTVNNILLEECVTGTVQNVDMLTRLYTALYWAGMYFIEKQEAGTDEDQQDFLLTKFRYKDITKCLCGLCISMEDLETIFNKEIVTPEELEVYYFQFDSLSLAIGDSALVTTDWLAANATKIVESAFLDGIVVPLPTIGRIGFTIKADTGTYSIYDELGQNVTDIVFNTTTDAAEGRQIFISKEYYAYSTLYYQLIKN